MLVVAEDVVASDHISEGGRARGINPTLVTGVKDVANSKPRAKGQSPLTEYNA